MFLRLVFESEHGLLATVVAARKYRSLELHFGHIVSQQDALDRLLAFSRYEGVRDRKGDTALLDIFSETLVSIQIFITPKGVETTVPEGKPQVAAASEGNRLSSART
ncbi:unnamed protein product [Caretta caretta]